jgi:hypothetical protein
MWGHAKFPSRFSQKTSMGSPLCGKELCDIMILYHEKWGKEQDYASD